MDLNIEESFDELVKLLMKEKLIKTINYIHYKLPKLFNKEDKLEMLKKINSQNIKVIPKSTQTKFVLQKRIHKEYLKTKIYNKGIIITKKPILDSKLRCQARVWGNAHISINSSDKKMIYGTQCSFKKHKDHKYCQKHLKKNKHGDFRKEPPPEIIKEYLHYNSK